MVTKKNGDLFFNFATIVSQEYVIKGLSFYDSLNERTQNFRMWICCMDDISYDALSKMNLEHAALIHVNEIEDEELRQVKSTRKLYEYCWTIKAPLCLHVLDHVDEIDHIIYCDSDMYFFSDPKPIHDEWGNHSAFLCRQRGTHHLEELHGIYQAGLIGFKRDEQGISILRWWKDKCIEKCFDIYDESWGDQKYLDHIPQLFAYVKLIGHIGIDAAPWNLVMNNNHDIRMKDNQVFLDDSELIAYHFGSLLIINQDQFDIWKLEPLPFNEAIIHYIYTPYIRHIQDSIKQLTNVLNTDISRLFAPPPSSYNPKNFLKL
jgi:hypothetical protein